MTRTLLYDGTCGLCARSVQFILRRERAPRTLRFAPLQGETARDLLQARPDLAHVDSIVWVVQSDGPPLCLVRSAAALAVLSYVGGPWKTVASLMRLVPRVLRDGAYDLLARLRYRMFGTDTSCLRPTPEQQTRFLP
jgi:predicted DCC family thiol-disulfide oxidoreductase YuxK